MEAVAAALAFAAPQAEPPPELRDRVLEAIGPEVVLERAAGGTAAAAPAAGRGGRASRGGRSGAGGWR